MSKRARSGIFPRLPESYTAWLATEIEKPSFQQRVSELRKRATSVLRKHGFRPPLLPAPEPRDRIYLHDEVREAWELLEASDVFSSVLDSPMLVAAAEAIGRLELAHYVSQKPENEDLVTSLWTNQTWLKSNGQATLSSLLACALKAGSLGERLEFRRHEQDVLDGRRARRAGRVRQIKAKKATEAIFRRIDFACEQEIRRKLQAGVRPGLQRDGKKISMKTFTTEVAKHVRKNLGHDENLNRRPSYKHVERIAKRLLNPPHEVTPISKLDRR